MRVAFTRSGEKSLLRLPAQRHGQILARIEALAAEPRTRRLDIEPLAGSDLFRLRVGGYRVLFSIDPERDLLTVELIRSRGDVYKR